MSLHFVVFLKSLLITNQGNYFENATACSEWILKQNVGTSHLNWYKRKAFMSIILWLAKTMVINLKFHLDPLVQFQRLYPMWYLCGSRQWRGLCNLEHKQFMVRLESLVILLILAHSIDLTRYSRGLCSWGPF